MEELGGLGGHGGGTQLHAGPLAALLGQRRLEDGAPGGDPQPGPAQRGPEEVQHAGREEDEHPRVDDGVDGDVAQGVQVSVVVVPAPYGVAVHPDLGADRRKD